MSSITAMRDAIQTTVGNAIAALHVYATVPDVVNLPALVVIPGPADFMGAMGRGLDTHTFNLCLLVSNREAGLAQDELDEFVTGAGSKSVRQAIWQTKNLGLADVDAGVTGMSSYGGQFETAKVEHVGAILTLTARTSGTA